LPISISVCVANEQESPLNTAGLRALQRDTAIWDAASFAARGADLGRQPRLKIKPSLKVTKIQAAVSPDCTYRLVKAAIDAAQSEICFYIYNASADHLLDLLRRAKARGVQIRLMYDVNDTSGDERAKLQRLGVDLKEAPSTGGRRVFTVCHQKFAVIDQAILLLGSANWASTSIPLITKPGAFKKGNREWIVRIDDRPLARWFRALFNADWKIPSLKAPAAAAEIEPVSEGTFVPAVLPKSPHKIFDIIQVELDQPATVTPIISPNNYFDMIVRLIDEASTSIDIEQQYILAGGPETKNVLTALSRRKDEIPIRIIVSPAYRKVGEKDNWELSVEWLSNFGLQDNLRAMNLDFYTHLHNKGVIFDRQRVVVSSTNWSENSLARAREAGVLIEAPAVAEYFASVFDFDWSIGVDPIEVPRNVAQRFMAAALVPGGLEPLHPADLV
jgi:phosphatidylserine/phosphatidylglycerophosphate/cardiolipin synthase-like enzyme